MKQKMQEQGDSDDRFGNDGEQIKGMKMIIEISNKQWNDLELIITIKFIILLFIMSADELFNSYSSNNQLESQLNQPPNDHQSSQPNKSQQFSCLQCHKKYTIKKSFVNHLKSHRIEYECKEQDCNKKFNYQSALGRHVKTHTGQKPFQCEYSNCLQKFSQKSNLSRHKKIHEQEKPFICNTCCKKFNTTTNLKQHIQIHVENKTDRKVFTCTMDGCDKKYLYMCNLKKHIKQHTDPLAQCIGEQSQQKHCFSYEISQCKIKLRVMGKNIDHSQILITYLQVQGSIFYDKNALQDEKLIQETVRQLLTKVNGSLSVCFQIHEDVNNMKVIDAINLFAGFSSLKRVTIFVSNYSIFKKCVFGLLQKFEIKQQSDI